MKSTGEKRRPRPQAQIVEWQVCEDERAWRTAESQAVESRVLDVQTPQWTPRWLRRWGMPSMLIVLVVALSGAGWLWGVAQRGLDAVETEVEAAIVTELWSVTPDHNPSEVALQELSLLNPMRVPTDAGEIVTELEIRELGTDWAVIDMLLQPTVAGPSYRQTRVYRYSDQGWLRAKVTAERWGRTRQLESDYFVFFLSHSRRRSSDAGCRSPRRPLSAAL